MHLVVGRLSMTAKGFGFIIPDVRDSEEETDVFVPGADLNTAMHGDRVVARVTPAQEEGRSREGEIIRILERANEKIVGTFESSKTFGFVTPDNTKLSQDIFVPKKAFRGAKTGSKVVVEITKWPDRRRNAEGKVIEVLGKVGDPGVDVLSVMRQYDLSETFPEDVQEAADNVEQEPSPEEYRGRRDRRDLPIVTVDGEDSKDLDDGVFARRNPDGSFFLGVYIADVSWYVRENQPLDREARERGTSVYLVDRVIPMLPKELSNGICSLNAGVDRLAMACEMQISPEGEVTSYEIVPTVIHVYRRLTYNIVNKVLVDKAEPFLSDNQDIREMLETLEALRHVLKAKRHRRGSIDFDVPEVKVKLDDKGHPVALIKREGSLAESIIEECMLIANETVARHMDTKQQPFMYRVHEQPSDEKIERLNSLLGAFGLFVHQSETGDIKPMDVQQVLEKVKGKPEERIISTVALRSMQQARYSDMSLGHFGLAARYYTHFTSPIRRYPDLIVHRLLRETFATGSIPAERQAKLRTMLPEIADHASERERIAIEAERETTDMKKIEYMAQFVGEEFTGIISGVTAFGILSSSTMASRDSSTSRRWSTITTSTAKSSSRWSASARIRRTASAMRSKSCSCARMSKSAISTSCSRTTAPMTRSRCGMPCAAAAIRGRSRRRPTRSIRTTRTARRTRAAARMPRSARHAAPSMTSSRTCRQQRARRSRRRSAATARRTAAPRARNSRARTMAAPRARSVRNASAITARAGSVPVTARSAVTARTAAGSATTIASR